MGIFYPGCILEASRDTVWAVGWEIRMQVSSVNFEESSSLTLLGLFVLGVCV